MAGFTEKQIVEKFIEEIAESIEDEIEHIDPKEEKLIASIKEHLKNLRKTTSINDSNLTKGIIGLMAFNEGITSLRYEESKKKE